MPNLIERLLKRKDTTTSQSVPLTPRQIEFERLIDQVQAEAAQNGPPISRKAAICGARIRIQDWLID